MVMTKLLKRACSTLPRRSSPACFLHHDHGLVHQLVVEVRNFQILEASCSLLHITATQVLSPHQYNLLDQVLDRALSLMVLFPPIPGPTSAASFLSETQSRSLGSTHGSSTSSLSLRQVPLSLAPPFLGRPRPRLFLGLLRFFAALFRLTRPWVRDTPGVEGSENEVALVGFFAF